MSVYDNTLYCLFKPGHPFTFCSYNENLDRIKRYGQHNPSRPYFFSHDITHFEVNDKHFVLLENGVISLMDKFTGWVTKRFDIDNFGLSPRSFVLYGGRNILVYGNRSKIMYAYDMNGNVQDFEVSEIKNNCWLYNYSESRFVFFNKFTFLLNISH
jgi:hypothetical protein